MSENFKYGIIIDSLSSRSHGSYTNNSLSTGETIPNSKEYTIQTHIIDAQGTFSEKTFYNGCFRFLEKTFQ